ncbi:hypothetical protein TVAG_494990 [Trichomonas vaginalis G3]|uniref:Bap-like n=1 Tax=Trichomonas vaginalis (strain ATCC PRA-98 / G3) TaxID=412133 RepID=A2EXU6_TRIV3|nr:hypothetical protein TVAGG3_0654030 [Trichomonas vaginalis G3]EAY02550.1 hypothetical protein TVAG_494990 [Trichomonas vaginalis G3]KAI5506042.1 hypothetical protein TVAGG3_0654030 [Trichomonas vaginalis G3]|eukprot:XP_001314789.1 hypothetical protein [Trichomonas vaginalis G3]
MLPFLLSTRILTIGKLSTERALFDLKIGESSSESDAISITNEQKGFIYCFKSTTEPTDDTCQITGLTATASAIPTSGNELTITYTISSQKSSIENFKFGVSAMINIPPTDGTNKNNVYRIDQTKQYLIYNPDSTTRDRIIFDFGNSPEENQKFPTNYECSTSDGTTAIDPFRAGSFTDVDNSIIGVSYFWEGLSVSSDNSVTLVTKVKLVEGIPITAIVDGAVDKGSTKQVTITPQYLKSQTNYYLYYSTTGDGSYSQVTEPYTYTSSTTFDYTTAQLQKSTTYYFYLSEKTGDTSNTIGIASVTIKVKPSVEIPEQANNKFYKSQTLTISDIKIYGDGQTTLEMSLTGDTTKVTNTYNLADTNGEKTDIPFVKALTDYSGEIILTAKVSNDDGETSKTFTFYVYDDPTATCATDPENTYTYSSSDETTSITIKCTIADEIITTGKYTYQLGTFSETTEQTYSENKIEITKTIKDFGIKYDKNGHTFSITITNDNTKPVTVTSSEMKFHIKNKPKLSSYSGSIIGTPTSSTTIKFIYSDIDDGKDLYLHYNDKHTVELIRQTAPKLTSNGTAEQEYSFGYTFTQDTTKDYKFWLSTTSDTSSVADDDAYKSGFLYLTFTSRSLSEVTCETTKTIYSNTDTTIRITCDTHDQYVTKGKYNVTLNANSKKDQEYTETPFNIDLTISEFSLVYKDGGYPLTLEMINENNEQLTISSQLNFNIMNKPSIESPTDQIVGESGQTKIITFKIKDFDDSKKLYLHYKEKNVQDSPTTTYETPFTSNGSQDAQDFQFSYIFPAEPLDKNYEFWFSTIQNFKNGESDVFDSNHHPLRLIGRTKPTVTCNSNKDTYSDTETITVTCSYEDVIKGGKYKYTFNGKESSETSYENTNTFPIEISTSGISYSKDGYPLAITVTNSNGEELQVTGTLTYYIVHQPTILSYSGTTLGTPGLQKAAVTFTIKDNDDHKILYMYYKERDVQGATITKLPGNFESNGGNKQTYSPTITFPSPAGTKVYLFWLSRFDTSDTTDIVKSNDYELTLRSKDQITTTIAWPTEQYYTNNDQITIDLGTNSKCTFDLVKDDGSNESITVPENQRTYKYTVTDLGYQSNKPYTLTIQNLKDSDEMEIQTTSTLTFTFYYRTKPKITSSSIEPPYLTDQKSFTLKTTVEDKDEGKVLKLKLKIGTNEIQISDTFTYSTQDNNKDWTIDFTSLNLGEGTHHLEFYLISDDCPEETCSATSDNVRRSNVVDDKSFDIVDPISFTITSEKDKSYQSSNPNGIPIQGRITGSGTITFTAVDNDEHITVEGTVSEVSSTEKEFTATVKYPNTITYGKKTVTIQAADTHQQTSTQKFSFWIKNVPTISDIVYTPNAVKPGDKFKISCKVTDQDIAKGKKLNLFIYDSENKKYEKIAVDQSDKTLTSKEYQFNTEGEKQFKLILTEKDTEPTDADIVKEEPLTVKVDKPESGKSTPEPTTDPEDLKAKENAAKKKKTTIIVVIVVICIVLLIIVAIVVILKMKKSSNKDSSSFSISDDIHFNNNETILDEARPTHNVTMQNPLFLTTNNVESDELFNDGE